MNDRRARSTLVYVGLLAALVFGLLLVGNVLLVLFYGIW